MPKHLPMQKKPEKLLPGKKALEQGAIEISDVIFQEEQQNAMAYGMDLFLGSEVHVEVIGKMDFTS